LWIADKPEHVEHLSAEEFLERVACEGLGTKTVYVVAAAA
jgi:hypothetical protein